MSDILVPIGGGLFKRFKDMGDGTVAEVISVAGGGGAIGAITGLYKVDETLTFTPSTGYTVTAGNWTRDGVNISGATSFTYKQTTADVGHNIDYKPTTWSFSAIGGTTGANIPGTPSIAATAGNASIGYTITPNASNGGAAVIDHIVSAYAAADGSLLSSKVVTTLSGTITDGIANGVSAYLKAIDRNSAGPSAASLASNIVTPTAVSPALISMSERQGIPSNMGGFNGPSSQTYRIFDNALQPVSSPSMWFFNWSSFPLITGKQQEQPNISPVYAAASYLTNTVGTGLDQSAATLTVAAWSKAIAGTAGFIVQLVGNTLVTPTAAAFAAAGGMLVDGGMTILVPGGFGVRCDEAATITAFKGAWARQVELSGELPRTLTIPAGTYAAGAAIPYTGTAPTNNWKYLASGTGITAPTFNFDDSTGTVATVDGAGVLTLSKAFTSTGGTITLTSRVPGGVAVNSDINRGDATCSAVGIRGKAVREKNWTSGVVSGVTQNTTGYNDFHAMIGWNADALGCMLLHGTSIENGQNDFGGNAAGATGMVRRACSLNRIPSIKTAVSSSSLQYEVPSSAFPGAAFGPMKMLLASYCTMMAGSPYNTRNFGWAGSITVSNGAKLLVQGFNKAYRLACRGGDATVYIISMLPGCTNTSTFNDAAGQTPSTQNLDANGTQQQYRLWCNSPGTWNRANGDPDYGIDIIPALYRDAAAHGMTMPGTDVADSIASQKWPYSPDWVAGGVFGPTPDGVHENKPVAELEAPIIAAGLPVYP